MKKSIVTILVLLAVGLSSCAHVFSSPFGESPDDIMNQDINLDLGVMRKEIEEGLKEEAEKQGIELDEETVGLLSRVVENRMGGINQYNTIIVTLDPTVANSIINATMAGLADVTSLSGSWLKEAAQTTNDPKTQPIVLPGKTEVIEKKVYVPVERKPEPKKPAEEPEKVSEPIVDKEPEGKTLEGVEQPEGALEEPEKAMDGPK